VDINYYNFSCFNVNILKRYNKELDSPKQRQRPCSWIGTSPCTKCLEV